MIFGALRSETCKSASIPKEGSRGRRRRDSFTVHYVSFCYLYERAAGVLTQPMVRCCDSRFGGPMRTEQTTASRIPAGVNGWRKVIPYKPNPLRALRARMSSLLYVARSDEVLELGGVQNSKVPQLEFKLGRHDFIYAIGLATWSSWSWSFYCPTYYLPYCNLPFHLST